MNSNRELCPRCDFIEARCLCKTLLTINNRTELIILQHPSETKHALNTVRIMKASFSNIKIFVGENFDNHLEFQNILAQKKCGLIFPTEKKVILNNENSNQLEKILLIDGSWNKAKKIYLSTTTLHSIPTFELELTEKSQYRIRASSLETSLSTLEATTQVLKILEPSLDTGSLELAFGQMIDFQIEKMGPEIFKKNYKNKKGDE